MPEEKVPCIVTRQDQVSHPYHGDGRLKKIIYPNTAGSKKLFLGIAVVPPGEAAHVFHKHEREMHGDRVLEYADDFEEFYFIVCGNGKMQWQIAGEELHESSVEAGDAIYMPIGTCKHRVVNDGDVVMEVLYGGTPLAKITVERQG